MVEISRKEHQKQLLPLLDKASKAKANRNKKIFFFSGIAALALFVIYITDPNTWLGGDDIHGDRKKRSHMTKKVPIKADSPSDKRFQDRELSDYHDLCIVGAGLSGAVIAERYANDRGQTSLIIERRDHIGGNCFDYIDDETGIRVSKYGAHLFHTYYERVWEYVQRWSKWTPYEHEVVALINDKYVPVPVNIDTVNALFDQNIQNSNEMDEWLAKEQVKPAHGGEPTNSEEMAKSRVGERLYELIFHPYTIKQWAKEPRELGPEVTARIPVRNNHDARYFADPHQALPSKGYTAIFEKIFDNPLITVKTGTDYFEVRDKLNCGKLYYTGPIDRYFADQGLKKLEYRSLDFERKVVKNVDHYQPKGVVNHPNSTRNYTRIVEYKHFLNQKSKDTVLYFEHSKDGGEPYYPVPNPKNQDLFRQYKDLAQKEFGVSFVGRLANYKYFNMDQTIENALALFDTDTGTTDVIVEHCDGDLTKAISIAQGLHANNTFIYSVCGQKPSSLPAQVLTLEKGTPSFLHHIHRSDVDFASQNFFLKDTTLTVGDIDKALVLMDSQSHFVDFAALPFQGCRSSRCGRTMDLSVGKEFFVTHEAIKRYLHSEQVHSHE